MRKTIEVLYDCNRCERKGCRGDVIKDKWGNIKQWLTCPGWQPTNIHHMKTTLLERASENPNSFIALGKILQDLGLQFDQTPEFPYFRFIIGQSDREVISN